MFKQLAIQKRFLIFYVLITILITPYTICLAQPLSLNNLPPFLPIKLTTNRLKLVKNSESKFIKLGISYEEGSKSVIFDYDTLEPHYRYSDSASFYVTNTRNIGTPHYAVGASFSFDKRSDYSYAKGTTFGVVLSKVSVYDKYTDGIHKDGYLCFLVGNNSVKPDSHMFKNYAGLSIIFNDTSGLRQVHLQTSPKLPDLSSGRYDIKFKYMGGLGLEVNGTPYEITIPYHITDRVYDYYFYPSLGFVSLTQAYNTSELKRGQPLYMNDVEFSVILGKKIIFNDKNNFTIETYDTDTTPFDVTPKTRVGYTSDGRWYHNGSPVSNPSELIGGVDNIYTLTTKYTPNKYNIIKHIGDQEEPQQVTFDSPYELQPPNKAGYTFGGWYTDPNFRTPYVKSENYTTPKDTHLYAKLTPNTYTITKHIDSQRIQQQVIFDSSFTIPEPSKTGYTFEGWYTDSSFRNPYVITPTYTTPNNLTLYAKFTPNNYNINYNYDSKREQQQVTFDNQFTLKQPTKTGYTFNNWFIDSNFRTQYDKPPKYNTPSDTELYGNFNPNRYIITYNYDGEQHQQQVTFDSTFDLIQTPSKVGYTFESWYTDSGFNSQYNKPRTYTTPDNIQLYGKFNPNQYTITKHIAGRQVTQQVTYDSPYTIPTPNKPGYTFEGWYTDKACTQAFNKTLDYTIPGDTTLYAKFTPNDYNINYNYDSKQEQQRVTFDSPYKLKTPTKVGYTFDNWYTDERYTIPYRKTPVYKTPRDTELYGKFNPNQYTITFNQTSGLPIKHRKSEYLSELPQPQQVLFDNEIPELPTPTHTGYNFMGWYTDSNFENPFTLETYTTPDDITLYAKWEIKQLQIDFDTQGTPVETLTFNWDTQPSPTKPITKLDGRLFMGWIDELDVNNPTPTEFDVTKNYKHPTSKTLVPRWEVYDYVLSFDLNGGTSNGGTNTGKIQFGERIPEPTPPTPPEGYRAFKHWVLVNNNHGEDIVWDFSQPYRYNKDCTLKAIYEPNTYQITYHIDNTQEQQEVTFNQPYELKANPTKEGHSFNGWFIDSNFRTPFVKTSTYKLPRNLELYAKFTPSNYEINYVTNGGEFTDASEVQPVTYGEAFELQTPIKEGFVFSGWYTDNTLKIKYIKPPTYNQEYNLRLYAKWSKISNIEIKYNTLQGTQIITHPVADGYPLNHIKELDYSSIIGYVPQDLYLDDGYTRIYSKPIYNTTDGKVFYLKLTPKEYSLAIQNQCNGEEHSEPLWTTPTPATISYGDSISTLIKQINAHTHLGFLKDGQPLTSDTIWTFDEDGIEIISQYQPKTINQETSVKVTFKDSDEPIIKAPLGSEIDIHFTPIIKSQDYTTNILVNDTPLTTLNSEQNKFTTTVREPFVVGDNKITIDFISEHFQPTKYKIPFTVFEGSDGSDITTSPDGSMNIPSLDITIKPSQSGDKPTLELDEKPPYIKLPPHTIVNTPTAKHIVVDGGKLYLTGRLEFNNRTLQQASSSTDIASIPTNDKVKTSSTFKYTEQSNPDLKFKDVIELIYPTTSVKLELTQSEYKIINNEKVVGHISKPYQPTVRQMSKGELALVVPKGTTIINPDGTEGELTTGGILYPNKDGNLDIVQGTVQPSKPTNPNPTPDTPNQPQEPPTSSQEPQQPSTSQTGGGTIVSKPSQQETASPKPQQPTQPQEQPQVPSQPTSTPPKDLEGHWSKDFIINLQQLGLVNGYTDGNFYPNRYITRADATLLVNNLIKHLGVSLNPKPQVSFKDIPQDAYYKSSVEYLASQGIIKGYGNNLFKPINNITREEALVMLKGMFEICHIELKSNTPTFSLVKDMGKVSHWAKQSVKFFLGKGLVRGDTNNNINPSKNITRAEFCTIIYNILNHLQP